MERTLEKSVCLRLPFMHPGFAVGECPSFAFFCPLDRSVPENAPYWQPSGLPLPAKAVADFMNMAASADSRELERQKSLLLMLPGFLSREKESRELKSLADFRQNGEVATEDGKSGLNTEKSHIFLLWLWFLEEKISAIADMERRCANLDSRLLQILLEDTVEWYSPGKAGTGRDLSPLPDWRRVARHMLSFVPANVPLLAEGPMRLDLVESADWRPFETVCGKPWRGPEKLLAMRAPAGELCGYDLENRDDVKMSLPRLWLIMEEG